MCVYVIEYFQGHCAPILYAAWAEAGAFPAADLKNLRKLDSDLEGHPTPVCIISAEDHHHHPSSSFFFLSG
jgi:transketolase N-terminal domain/subunit